MLLADNVTFPSDAPPPLFSAAVLTSPWCWWCRLEKACGWDHLVPTSRGGPDTVANTVAACATCNSRKGQRTPAEYGAWLLQRAATMATDCPRCGSGPGEWCVTTRSYSRRRTTNLHIERREAAR